MWIVALGIYLAGINLLAVIVTLRDKAAAQKRRRRTPEATLLWIAALGGALAMYITMKAARHKTRKMKFMVGVPIALISHIAVAALWWCGANGMIGL